jgi:prophage DNA circulation protein
MADSSVNLGVFVDLPRAKFGDYEFPVEGMRIKGGLRDHVHEYPHSPGGAPEKLGRKLYEIDVTANFQATFRAWPGLWPDRLADLRDMFEKEETASLVIPTIGTIQAYCFEWDQEMTAKILSGEKATFKFREDQTTAFLIENLVQVSVQSMAAAGDRFAAEAAKQDPQLGIFDQITNAVNSGLALIDTANAYFGLIEAKVLGIIQLCREADQRVSLFLDPSNNAMLEALKELWASATTLHENLLQKSNPLTTYTVPATMAVTQISTILYGSTDRAMEILQLNPIENAFEVPGGTRLRVYEAAA